MERQLAAVSRWWIDDLRDALVDAEGEHDGLALLARYGEAFPASYRELNAPGPRSTTSAGWRRSRPARASPPRCTGPVEARPRTCG